MPIQYLRLESGGLIELEGAGSNQGGHAAIELESSTPTPAMAQSPADPNYDLQGALTGFLPGIVIQRELMDAGAAQYAANGYLPLTQAQALACLTAANALDPPDMMTSPPAFNDPTTETPYPPAPPAPIPLNGSFTGTAGGYPVPLVLMNLPRFRDSNPSPRDMLSATGRDRRVVGG